MLAVELALYKNDSHALGSGFIDEFFHRGGRGLLAVGFYRQLLEVVRLGEVGQRRVVNDERAVGECVQHRVQGGVGGVDFGQERGVGRSVDCGVRRVEEAEGAEGVFGHLTCGGRRVPDMRVAPAVCVLVVRGGIAIDPTNALGEVEDLQMRVLLHNGRHPDLLKPDASDTQIGAATGHGHHFLRRGVERFRTLPGRHYGVDREMRASDALGKVALRLYRYGHAMAIVGRLPSAARAARRSQQPEQQQTRRGGLGHGHGPPSSGRANGVPRREPTDRNHGDEDGQQIPGRHAHGILVADEGPRLPEPNETKRLLHKAKRDADSYAHDGAQERNHTSFVEEDAANQTLAGAHTAQHLHIVFLLDDEHGERADYVKQSDGKDEGEDEKGHPFLDLHHAERRFLLLETVFYAEVLAQPLLDLLLEVADPGPGFQLKFESRHLARIVVQHVAH